MITRPLSLIGRRELFLFLGAYLRLLDVARCADRRRPLRRRPANARVDRRTLRGALGVDDRGLRAAARLTGTAVIWVLNNLYLAAQLIVVPGALIWPLPALAARCT